MHKPYRVPSFSERAMVLTFAKRAPISWWKKANRAFTWPAGDNHRRVGCLGLRKICFSFTPLFSKYILVSKTTSAAHGTHRNDVCLSFAGGLTARRVHGKLVGLGSKWLKGYQNVGAAVWWNVLYTVNHLPHRMFTCLLRRGQKQSFVYLVGAPCSQ